MAAAVKEGGVYADKAGVFAKVAGAYVAASAGVVASGLSVWSAAASAVKAGTSSTNIVILGDSTSVGASALIEGSSSGARPYCPAAVIAGYLNANGVPCTRNTFNGIEGCNSLAALAIYDSRVSFETIANYSLSGSIFGESNLTESNGNTSKFSITPEESGWDTVRIWTVKPTVASSFYGVRVYANGSGTNFAGITRFQTDANDLMYNDVTPPGGTTSIQISNSPSSVVPMTIVGIEFLSSSERKVRVYNGAIIGARSTSITGQSGAASTINMLGQLAPSLTVLNCALNDYGVTNQTNYTNAMQSIITAAKLTGDVLLVMPHPIGTANESYAAAFQGYLQTLATSNSCKFLSIHDRWVSYAAAVAAGYMWNTTDFIHPKAAGYADIGQALFTALTT